MSPQGFHERGFTLLELLVAVALLGMMSVILLNGVQFGARAWERAEARLDRASDRAAREGLLRRQLSQIYPIRRDRRADAQLVFNGARDALHFAGPAPAHAAVAGTYIYDLRVSADGRKELVLSWSMMGNGAYPGRIVLLRDVRSVELSYFGALRQDRPSAWRSSWQNGEYLPRMISLRVAGSGGETDGPIEMVVAPRLWDAVEGGM
jgi:general secretion pathway protein J